MAVCPKCETFRLLDNDCQPVVYCSHPKPCLIPWWWHEGYTVDSQEIQFEKILRKVVTLEEA